MNDPVLKSKDLANLLGMPLEAVYKLGYLDGCPAYNAGTGRKRRLLWPQQKTLDWLELRKKSTTPKHATPPSRRRPRISDYLARADEIKQRAGR